MRYLVRFAVLIVFAVAAVGPVPASAWGPEGHEVIAEVAHDLLPADLQAKFDQILKGGKGLSVSYTDSSGHEHTCGASTLDQLSNWPDCVRYGGKYASTYGAHFNDIPYCPKPPAAKSPASACQGTACATKFLPQKIAQLKAAGTKPVDRAAALSFVVHIVGDMHQPLHMIDNGDKGGNAIPVTVDGEASNLHRVWDGDVVTEAYGSTAEAITGTRDLAVQHAAEWSHPSPGQADFDAWASASHVIAVAAYDAITPKPACGNSGTAKRTIDAAYFSTFDATVKEQLAKAAVRLSDVLKDALAAAP